MPVDEKKIALLHDAWFAHATLTSNPPLSEAETKKLFFEIRDELCNEIGKDEAVRLLIPILRDIPDSAREPAIRYLMLKVPPDQLRAVYYSPQNNIGDNSFHMTGGLALRNLLRRGGFRWNDVYLDDRAPDILAEAARRFVEEGPIVEENPITESNPQKPSQFRRFYHRLRDLLQRR